MSMKDYRTIVVGTDGSSLGEPTVGRAAWLAKHDDADLVIWSPSVDGNDTAVGGAGGDGLRVPSGSAADAYEIVPDADGVSVRGGGSQISLEEFEDVDLQTGGGGARRRHLRLAGAAPYGLPLGWQACCLHRNSGQGTSSEMCTHCCQQVNMHSLDSHTSPQVWTA